MSGPAQPTGTDVRQWALYVVLSADGDEAVDRAWEQAIEAGVDEDALNSRILRMRTQGQNDPTPEMGAQGGQPRRPRRGINKDSRLIRAFIAEELVPAYDRMTVRQVYYQVSSVAGLVPKTERGYKKVQRQVLAMRRAGELDWSFIADGTRWQRKPSTWESSDDAFDAMVRHYRRDLWQSQGVRIEIWLEKDALADVIVDTTSRWDVALMVSRGQSSATFLHRAAMEAQRAYEFDEIETFVYTLYDHDPGGALRAHPTIARDLPRFAPEVPIFVEKLAVTPQQITAWNLPTRPGKTKDSQAKEWGNRPNVELDAIDPARLNNLVDSAIRRHVDERAWEVEQAIEAEEKEGLMAMLENWRQSNNGRHGR